MTARANANRNVVTRNVGPLNVSTHGGCSVLLLETEPIDDSSAMIDLGSINADRGSVQDYLSAVGDELPIYQESGLAPPLYFAASALGLLLRRMDLPSGAVHSLQEIETVNPPATGKSVRVRARIEKPRERGGLKFITAACELLTADGRSAISSKSTVMLTGAAANSGTPVRLQPDSPGGPAAPSDLPVVTRTITQGLLNSYAKASGDSNPLHLDSEFAAGTQFGGIIAHGMLTLALIGEMMAAAHGRKWLETGSLRVRFKSAAYLEDRVETIGSAAKGKTDQFAVGVINSATGQELVVGTATLKTS